MPSYPYRGDTAHLPCSSCWLYPRPQISAPLLGDLTITSEVLVHIHAKMFSMHESVVHVQNKIILPYEEDSRGDSVKTCRTSRINTVQSALAYRGVDSFGTGNGKLVVCN